MNNIIDISQLPPYPLPLLSDEDARTVNNKGWSFFNVYSLRELRDIYLLYVVHPGLTIPAFSKLVENHIKYEEKEWTERRVLENLNALKNLKLISIEGDIQQHVFQGRDLNSDLSADDKDKLKALFFSYFRFNEMSSWFFSPDFHKQLQSQYLESNLTESSQPIYYLSDNNRFTDTFLYTIDDPMCKYLIPHNMSHAMRFWDVFLKWGTTLKLIDKFNLSKLAIKTRDNKEISVAYFVNQFKPFDLFSFLTENAAGSTRNFFIPDLIFSIVKKTRYSVDTIKEHIKSEIMANDKLTFERTSEIFIIKGKQSPKKIREATYLYPVINGNYISHLIIRK